MSRRFVETTGNKLDYGFDLIAIESIECIHDVIDVGTCFQILENCRYRHPGAFQYPGTAYLSGYALDSWALGPV